MFKLVVLGKNEAVSADKAFKAYEAVASGLKF